MNGLPLFQLIPEASIIFRTFIASQSINHNKVQGCDYLEIWKWHLFLYSSSESQNIRMIGGWGGEEIDR